MINFNQLIQRYKKIYLSIRAYFRLKKYLFSGRKPWTTGYGEYKEKYLCNSFKNNDLLDCFNNNKRLPINYGVGIDERVVEYGWLFSRIGDENQFLLDAGSALNLPYILGQPVLKNRSIVIYNLAPEQIIRRSNLSYIYGDLKQTILRSECFDEIVCVSVLEHVGMNNTLLYSENSTYNEFNPDDYQVVIREFKRLLKPGGKLFLTVPYGCYGNHGWLQQFDQKMIKKLIEVFDGSRNEVIYYKYSSTGWQISDSVDSANCSYFDIHKKSGYDQDNAAAARAVACIELVK
ncbi:MAG: class I SAM-dependent methyltransferase [Desulfobacteraceae bacterium]|nr:class I SAM-dependent methyltransferase [Desulfobacteraceae bacterium]